MFPTNTETPTSSSSPSSSSSSQLTNRAAKPTNATPTNRKTTIKTAPKHIPTYETLILILLCTAATIDCQLYQIPPDSKNSQAPMSLIINPEDQDVSLTLRPPATVYTDIIDSKDSATDLGPGNAEKVTTNNTERLSNETTITSIGSSITASTVTEVIVTNESRIVSTTFVASEATTHTPVVTFWANHLQPPSDETATTTTTAATKRPLQLPSQQPFPPPQPPPPRPSPSPSPTLTQFSTEILPLTSDVKITGLFTHSYNSTTANKTVTTEEFSEVTSATVHTTATPLRTETIPSTLTAATTLRPITEQWDLKFKIGKQFTRAMNDPTSAEYSEVIKLVNPGLEKSCRELLQGSFQSLDQNYKLSSGSVVVETYVTVLGGNSSVIGNTDAWDQSLQNTLPGLFLNGSFVITKKPQESTNTTPSPNTTDYLAIGISCAVLFVIIVILLITVPIIIAYKKRSRQKNNNTPSKHGSEVNAESLTFPSRLQRGARAWMASSGTVSIRSADVGSEAKNADGVSRSGGGDGSDDGGCGRIDERIVEGGPHAPLSRSDSDEDDRKTDVSLHRPRRNDDTIISLTTGSIYVERDSNLTEWNNRNRNADDAINGDRRKNYNVGGGVKKLNGAPLARENFAFEPNLGDPASDINQYGYRPHVLTRQITECSESTNYDINENTPKRMQIGDRIPSYVSTASSTASMCKLPRVHVSKIDNDDNTIPNKYSQPEQNNNTYTDTEPPSIHFCNVAKKSQLQSNYHQILAPTSFKTENDVYPKYRRKPANFGGLFIPGSNSSLQGNSSIGSRLSSAEPSLEDIDLQQISRVDDLFPVNRDQSIKSTLTTRAKKLLGKNSDDKLYRANT